MAKYRSLEPIAYVQDDSVVSVSADRVIDLDEAQAQSLAGRVVCVENRVDSMFPSGTPIIEDHIVRAVPHLHVAGEPVEPPAPAAKPKPFAKPEDKPKSN